MENRILTYPNEVLTTKAVMLTKAEIKNMQGVLRELKEYVGKTPHAAGLALPQIGISKRAFAAKLKINGIEQTEVFINPRIIPFDKEKEIDIEGCLSIPEQSFFVERFYGVEIIYQTVNGKMKKIKLKGFNARVVQHENDHLDGKLISAIGTIIGEKVAQ